MTKGSYARCCVFVLIAVAFLALFLYAFTRESNYDSETVADKYDPDNAENAIVSHNSEGEGNYSFFDATDSYVYFSYSEQSAQVDAYNYLGEYQFTVLLSSRENGAVSIRCHENLLFISSKYGNVFVFSGDRLVEQYSRENADSKGYTSSWFQKRSVPIKMGFARIYRQRAAGTDMIHIPRVIISRSLVGYLTIATVLCCMAVYLIIWKKKK